MPVTHGGSSCSWALYSWGRRRRGKQRRGCPKKEPKGLPKGAKLEINNRFLTMVIPEKDIKRMSKKQAPLTKIVQAPLIKKERIVFNKDITSASKKTIRNRTGNKQIRIHGCRLDSNEESIYIHAYIHMCIHMCLKAFSYICVHIYIYINTIIQI